MPPGAIVAARTAATTIDSVCGRQGQDDDDRHEQAEGDEQPPAPLGGPIEPGRDDGVCRSLGVSAWPEDVDEGACQAQHQRDVAGTAMMSPVTPASAAPTGRATMTTAGWMRTLCG